MGRKRERKRRKCLPVKTERLKKTTRPAGACMTKQGPPRRETVLTSVGELLTTGIWQSGQSSTKLRDQNLESLIQMRLKIEPLEPTEKGHPLTIQRTDQLLLD